MAASFTNELKVGAFTVVAVGLLVFGYLFTYDGVNAYQYELANRVFNWQGYDVDLDMQIETIEQRAGDLAAISRDTLRTAAAVAITVTEVAARTWIHGAGEHESGGVGQRHGGAGDRDKAVFEGLTEDLQHVLLELWEFVEKQDAVVGNRYFSWAWMGAATDQAGV